jgi:SOS-response transcriptional repressor LexA
MEPQFHDQDLLLIERDVPFNALKRGVFGIFSLDGEFTFKRLNIQSNNLILLEPLNSKYSTIAANPATLRIYGIAIAIFRSLKEGMLCL